MQECFIHLILYLVYDGHEYPLLILSAMGFDYPRTVTLLTHYIGPIYSKQRKELSGDLHNSIDPTEASEIVRAIGDMPYDYSAVWSLKNYKSVLKDAEYNPVQFHITDWIPQFVVMQHKARRCSSMQCCTVGLEGSMQRCPNGCMPYGGEKLSSYTGTWSRTDVT